MVSLEGFDAEKIEPVVEMKPIPAGEYTAVIESSEKKPTKNGQGHYIQLVVQIVDGDYKGRKIYDNLNLWNASSQAVEIAKGTMSAICRAVGVLRPSDSSDLHNKPLTIVTKNEKYNDTIQSRIKAYKARGPASAQAPDNSGYSEPITEQPDPNKALKETSADAPWN
jgi:hypothetical protein